MRLTPAQGAVHLICGREVPRSGVSSLRERIALGRRLLMEITQVDFGYDLQRWHDHLKETRECGYTWNRSVALPKIMKEALASPAWKKAVAALQAKANS